ncbi:MAG: hypothetical protein ACLFR1_13345 [Spirochaetia bacterium]
MKNAIPRVIFSVLFFLLTSGLFAQQIEADSVLDWSQGTLTLDLSVSLADRREALPVARYRAEESLFRALPDHLRAEMFPLYVDSYHTVLEFSRTSPRIVTAINGLAEEGEMRFSRLSPDLQTLTVRYEFQLYPNICSLFVEHSDGYTPPRTVLYEPSAEFTGIVIYAKEEFPLHGEEGSHLPVPGLFPDIYNEEMELLYEREMIDPEYARQWGGAAYSLEADTQEFEERVGERPLYIMPVQVFGKYPTDFIISMQDSRRITFDGMNHRLLREARVLVLYAEAESGQENNEQILE